MSTSRESVADLYSKIADAENMRLATHPMEREITLRTIRQALTGSSGKSKPSSDAEGAALGKRIADVGGGPGKLSFVLADEGHHVDLIDLSPGLIQLAQAEQDRRRKSTDSDLGGDNGNNSSKSGHALLASINVGDAMDPNLPLEADSYDAVLLLGPLYHLFEESERVAAVQNALKLAKPGQGFVFVAFVSFEAHLRDLAMREPQRLVEQADFYSAYVSFLHSFTLHEHVQYVSLHAAFAMSGATGLTWDNYGVLKLQLASGRYARTNQAQGTTSQSFHTSSTHARQFLKQHFAGQAELVSLRSTEGILGGGLDAKLADAEPRVLKAWVDLMFDEFSEHERHLGGADHLLAVLRRK